MTKSVILNELDVCIANKENDIKYANKLNRNSDRVRYLRVVKGYKQNEVAEMIGISARQVQRIEKKLKNI
ncbi:helix-turn-helix domain-containing protein [Clostridium butyricum]|uniref:RNA polymerase sigma-G factor n=1 Tax=Clostridium butyricum E4 str. BoNT E BL5262 TaxID=632245 RepID=C4IH11_CLOBU|nr:helix-turn-helix domain-containing protein [Clostridium butyricum]EEP53863.1 RNA polymerase sigma-G factor [Clostridium butyricum E4 str. BoNT E BL5262]NFL30573.1 helix-turn-helix domain-containing protein [Clostridium butyricum]NFS19528.1 helix-turn-helix domain-containing protein [Clostridium butyricum]